MPLYESNPETIKTELATFFEVFPNGTVWANDIGTEGYDVVLLGWNGPATIDLENMQRRWTGNVAASLAQVNFRTPMELLATYAGRAAELKPWIGDAHVNGDMDLRLQYMAGMGLNFNNASLIKEEMGNYYKYPADIFTGSAEVRQQMQSNLRR